MNLIAEHSPMTADQWAERWQKEADARNELFSENKAMRDYLKTMNRDCYQIITDKPALVVFC